jgi:hypothetical protein
MKDDDSRNTCKKCNSPDSKHDNQPNTIVNCCMDKDSNSGIANNQIIEFQYDERGQTNTNIPISGNPSAPTQALSVRFNQINQGDRVWLSGVIVVDNNDMNAAANLLLIIQRVSPITGTPEEIYSFQVNINADTIPGDDRTIVPFSHVDVPSTQLFDIEYRVVLADQTLSLSGPNTLTAVRFGR